MGSREKLTSAMADLLWERGYAATSPRDVLAMAGVGQGSMYHYFSGKHELAVEALKTVRARVIANDYLLTGEGSPLERMLTFLSQPRAGTRGCRIGRMTQDPQVVTDEKLSAIVAEAFQMMTERWSQVIQQAIDAGELPRATQARQLACTLVAVIQGGYVLARAEGSQEPMDAAILGAIALLESASAAAQSPSIPIEQSP